MTIEEALNILDQALLPIVGTKQQHQILDEAVTVIKTELLKMKDPSAPTENDPAR